MIVAIVDLRLQPLLVLWLIRHCILVAFDYRVDVYET